MARSELVRQLRTAREVFCGVGTKQIKLQLNRLGRANLLAHAFRIALEIEDCSVLGKKYRGEWSTTYYAKKTALIHELIEICKEAGWTHGAHKSDVSYPTHIVYFELPGCEQISFHTNLRTEIPTYEKEWDGKRESTLGKLEVAIDSFLKNGAPLFALKQQPELFN